MRKAIKSGLLALTMVMAASTTSFAAPEILTYNDWQVFIDRTDTGEDLRVACTIQSVTIGEDGREWRLHTGSSNGDARPPHYFAGVYLDEQVKPGMQPSVTPGDTIAVVIDGQDKDYVPVETVQDDRGAYVTRIVLTQGGSNADMLRAMKQGSSALFRVETGGQPRPAFQNSSLRGFTAAYQKMSEACQFESSDL